MGQKIGQMALNGKDNSGSFEIRFLYILTWICSVCCQSDPVWALTPDPPENCHLNVKEIAKNLTFFSKKIDKNCLVLINTEHLRVNKKYHRSLKTTIHTKSQ